GDGDGRPPQAGGSALGARDAGHGAGARPRRGRGRRRDRDRPGGRAARALRGDGALLEEPRGRLGAWRPWRRARRQAAQGRRRDGDAEDGGGGSGGPQGAREETREPLKKGTQALSTYGT